jgi:hypothetical protein
VLNSFVFVRVAFSVLFVSNPLQKMDGGVGSLMVRLGDQFLKSEFNSFWCANFEV